MRIFYIIIILIYPNRCVSNKYYNYTLYRAIPHKNEHLKFLLNLTEAYNANFWRLPSLINKPTEFVIPPAIKEAFLRNADLQNIDLTTLIEDIQSAFDKQKVKAYVRRKMESFDWSNFFRLEDIYEWLKDLAHTYSNVMKLQSIGKTYENRDILVVKINIGRAENKPKVIVEGGIHAREWISIAFVTYFLHQLLTSNKNIALKSMAESYEWLFVPVLNPDGYEYTHLKDRMYRKNLRGVDINRNFEIQFGTVGVSSSVNSEVYCGPAAFSEAESLAMSELVRANEKNLKYYLAFHSYGQYIIIPYAFSVKHQDNFDEVYHVGRKVAEGILNTYGTKYSVGTAYDTVGYLTSGVSGCWVKKSFNVPYVLTFELRDDGKHGFALPPNQILPTCKETMNGLIQLLSNTSTADDRKLKQGAAKGNTITITKSFIFLGNICWFIIARFY